jgi:hypothetical protein
VHCSSSKPYLFRLAFIYLFVCLFVCCLFTEDPAIRFAKALGFYEDNVEWTINRSSIGGVSVIVGVDRLMIVVYRCIRLGNQFLCCLSPLYVLQSGSKEDRNRRLSFEEGYGSFADFAEDLPSRVVDEIDMAAVRKKSPNSSPSQYSKMPPSPP